MFDWLGFVTPAAGSDVIAASAGAVLLRIVYCSLIIIKSHECPSPILRRPAFRVKAPVSESINSSYQEAFQRYDINYLISWLCEDGGLEMEEGNDISCCSCWVLVYSITLLCSLYWKPNPGCAGNQTCFAAQATTTGRGPMVSHIAQLYAVQSQIVDWHMVMRKFLTFNSIDHPQHHHRKSNGTRLSWLLNLAAN